MAITEAHDCLTRHNDFKMVENESEEIQGYSMSVIDSGILANLGAQQLAMNFTLIFLLYKIDMANQNTNAVGNKTIFPYFSVDFSFQVIPSTSHLIISSFVNEKLLISATLNCFSL